MYIDARLIFEDFLITNAAIVIPGWSGIYQNRKILGMLNTRSWVMIR